MQKTFLRTLTLVAALLLALAAFGQGAPDFSRIVILGDSLSAGYMDGSLNEHGQTYSYAERFAQQAGYPLTMPLVTYPGLPIALKLVGVDPVTGFPVIVPDGTTPGHLINPMSQSTNLAVPGQTSVDCLSKVPDGTGTMTDLVLGYPWVFIQGHEPLSQADLAGRLDPSFAILWIGSNDVLGGALAGDATYVVPPSAFAQAFPAIVAKLQATGAKLVVANLPDVTIIPALTPGTYLKMIGVPLKKLGITRKDFVTPYGLPHVRAILTGEDPGPLAPGEVLTAKEAKALRAIVKADNKTIHDVAGQAGIPVVDINFELTKLSKRGYQTDDGQFITTMFLGGVFGLDGVHPTHAGQEILANLFIDKVNATYGTSLDKVPVLAGSEFAPAEPGVPDIPLGSFDPIVGKPYAVAP